jgi:microcystin degradation protein MlrC
VRDDGSFVNDGPLAAGVRFDMGRVAVLGVGNVVVLAQTHAMMPNDPSMFRSMGIDLGALDAVVLKGAAAPRAGWASRARDVLDVRTPGPTSSNLDDVRFDRAARPLWPIDDFEWQPAE